MRHVPASGTSGISCDREVHDEGNGVLQMELKMDKSGISGLINTSVRIRLPGQEDT